MIPEKQTKQYKLTLPFTEYTLQPSLRNEQQSTRRVEQQMQTVKESSKWFCPFLLSYYQSIRLKSKQNQIILKAAKQNCTLDTYLKKDIVVKKKLVVINNILDGLLQLQGNFYASLNLSPRNILIFIDDGEPIARLPVHTIWKKKDSQWFFNNRELFMAENKADHIYIPPEMHNKATTVLDLDRYDLWTVAMTIIQILWVKQEIKIDYVTKGSKYSLEENPNPIVNIKYEPSIKKIKFFNEDECIKVVTDNLWFDPSKRTSTLKILKDCFYKALIERQPPFRLDQKSVRQFSYKFCQDKKSKEEELRNLKSQNFTLLNQDLETKIIAYLESRKHKILKPDTFRKIYKASLYNFSSRIFHEKCDTLSNLLVVFETSDHKKFCAYTPVPFDLDALEGIFGTYLPDESGQTFVYSVAANEFYTLKDRAKAIGISPNHGPIFGETDIIIGDSNIANLSKFPKSFQAVGKSSKGKLTTGQVFTLAEYQAYVVTFI